MLGPTVPALRKCYAASHCHQVRSLWSVLLVRNLPGTTFPPKHIIKRGLVTTAIQAAKKRSSSSSRYLSRQSSDPYVLSRTSPSHASSLALPSSSDDHLSDESFVSRSAFKLYELEQKHRFLGSKAGKAASGKGRIIVDLGAAPGGWTQMALRCRRSPKVEDERVEDEPENFATRPKGPAPIFALDLLPLHPSVQNLPGVSFIQGDFESEDVKQRLAEELRSYSRSEEEQAAQDEPKVDVIMSDMLANTTGSPVRDSALSLSLLYHLYLFAQRHLAASRSSFLVLKIFSSPEAEAFRKKMLQYSSTARRKKSEAAGDGNTLVKGGAFESVKAEKPPSSRKESREVYWICKGFRGVEKTWTLDEWYEMEEAAS